ncbi:MAG TPA: hypothetical protein VIV60_12030 [Polyangiaceae bacterium]
MKICRLISLASLWSSLAVMSACSANAKRAPDVAAPPPSPRHDYSSTWVYAVGEVDAPTASDCGKALQLAESESECVGAVCKYGVHLLKDFEGVCAKLVTIPQHERAKALRSNLARRAAEPASTCSKAVDEWLQRGCGDDGACELEVRQWATRCSQDLHSPLATQLLEHLIENSLREPRRIKFDVKACVSAKKQLEQAALCDKAFDCEDALKRIDQYVERCSEGNHSGIPLEQAVQVMRIRFGANKPTEPISLAKGSSKIPSQPGLLTFTDGTGAIMHVCDEPVSDLPRYIEQRRRCENGVVTVLVSVPTGDGTSLEVRHLRHESDSAFSAAHPEMLVKGEAAMRMP